MGIFGKRKITQVGTIVSRLVEDDDVLPSLLTGAIRSIFEEANVSEYVFQSMSGSVGVKAHQFYNYADRSYVHGLPSGQTFVSTQGRAEVETVIEAAEGAEVLIEYVRYGPINTLHTGWMKLIEEHGYNPLTNELVTLSAANTGKVYLTDLIVVVPVADKDSYGRTGLVQWGTPATDGYTPERPMSGDLSIPGLSGIAEHSPVKISDTASALHLVATVIWQENDDASKEYQRATHTILVDGFSNDNNYFHAKYRIGNLIKYWLYEDGEGTHAAIDAVFTESPAVSGTYFPFIHFRSNKTSVIEDKNSAAYITGKKAADYLGIDFDAVSTGIDESPDIADVESVFLTMAVPATSTDPNECRYLFDYFNRLYLETEASGNLPSSNWEDLSDISDFFSNTYEERSTVIKDAQFKMALSNAGIHKRTISGSIGDGAIGNYEAVVDEYEYSRTFIQDLSVADEIVEQEVTLTEVRYAYKYRHQIVTGLYEEIIIKDLKMTYFVFGDYSTAGEDGNDILLIPLDKTITAGYKFTAREALYMRSLHFVFNSHIVTKLKWYQTGLFRIIIIVIAIIITILSYGSDGGSTIATALAATGVTGLIVTIVVNIIIGELIKKGFTVFAEAIGQEAALVLAIVAIVFGAYSAVEHGSVVGAPWASEMISIASNLHKEVLVLKYKDLAEESAAFELYKDEKDQELTDGDSLLETSHVLSPLTFFGESPENFYNRTIHSGNIGTIGFDAISNYVDMSLRLPTFNDTLGEQFNALPINQS